MSSDALSSNAFVFVVCGSREHLDTLQYSLQAMQRMSRSRVIVVTDSTRNEIPIQWPDIVDVQTPGHMNNHQASIYLKTSLNRILPSGPCYCYLDTDVIAIQSNVDEIFHFKRGPVTFAADHSRLMGFSPHALYCGCVERDAANQAELKELLAYNAAQADQPPSPPSPPPMVEKTTFLARLRRMLASRLSGRSTEIREEAATPLLPETPPIATPVDEREERFARWRFDHDMWRWFTPEGEEVHIVNCNHLKERIAETFGILVHDHNWQHWNGGVFLFDAESHAFLDAWHKKTIDIFTNPAWRTRDQGTLIATVWEFGLQDNPVLPNRFNFIADYYNPTCVGLAADRAGVTNDGFVTTIFPSLIHIFYHFGDQTWDLWNWVDALVEGRGSSEVLGEESTRLASDHPAVAVVRESETSC